MPSLEGLSEELLLERLGKPETNPVNRAEGRPLAVGMPRYLVWPATIRIEDSSLENPTKLIDFGESFMPFDKPTTLHTPLAVRAPELLLEQDWNIRVDLWSLGCMVSCSRKLDRGFAVLKIQIFELVAGQPLFSGIMARKEDIIQQMVNTMGKLPEEWQIRWQSMLKEGQYILHTEAAQTAMILPNTGSVLRMHVNANISSHHR